MGQDKTSQGTPLSQKEVTPIKQLVDALFLTLPKEYHSVLVLLLLLIVLIDALKIAWSFQTLNFSIIRREVPAAVGTDNRFGQIGVIVPNVMIIT